MMKKTQKTEVLEYIKANGGITRLDAFLDLGIAELPARICELKAEGYHFKEERVPFTTRLNKKSSYIRYSIM